MKKNKSKSKSIIGTIISLIVISATGISSYFAYQNGFFSSLTKKQENTSNLVKENLKILTNLKKKFFKPAELTRIGHWNILNFGGERSFKNSFKVNSIVKIILETNLDLIGLTEINYDQGKKVENIVKTLNEIDEDKSWKVITQPVEDMAYETNKDISEQVSILYKESKFKPEAFSNGRIGSSYGETFFKDEFNRDTRFKRPLFGVLFKELKSNKNLVAFYGHLDSPRAKKSRTKTQFIELNSKLFSQQGSQEVAEAKQIDDAFIYFKNLSPNNTSLFFGGDTNIMTKNNKLFTSEEFTSKNIQNYYENMTINKNLLKEEYEYYKTSLGESKGYANAYDKLLFIENGLDFINEYEKVNKFKTMSSPEGYSYSSVWFRGDIANAFETQLLGENFKKMWKDEVNKVINDSKKKDKYINYSNHSIVKNGISDHDITWIDYK
ncbi:MnuA family membrane nuclease [Mycoplasma phocimorsus]|uniref:MnuA family membrane nuclease n=1 Tax=Mycoplasma phocimorsus TaxID=3045839 RepID=UPI0024C08BB4|nr:hypothetical protein [Mycoplasma phocimorsus]MDJ1648396.1 hypothetical protein [Mycoplasma phocimorsus]